MNKYINKGFFLLLLGFSPFAMADSQPLDLISIYIANKSKDTKKVKIGFLGQGKKCTNSFKERSIKPGMASRFDIPQGCCPSSILTTDSKSTIVKLHQLEFSEKCDSLTEDNLLDLVFVLESSYSMFGASTTLRKASIQELNPILDAVDSGEKIKFK